MGCQCKTLRFLHGPFQFSLDPFKLYVEGFLICDLIGLLKLLPFKKGISMSIERFVVDNI